MAHVACIALGSNLGDRRANLDGAIAVLRSHPGIVVRRVSSWIETEPVGGPPGQGRYLNGAAVIETDLSPHELLSVLRSVEQQFGRTRGAANASRTLDIDLLLYDDRIIDEPGLTVPHPRMHERRFVLEPLAQIAPNARHPTRGTTVARLLACLTDSAP
jgi:2-amino-4-hydroxy-6-hydroxymethyldihydropteridine diphosphokinase